MANPTVQEVDFSSLSSILNTTKLQKDNPALYQLLAAMIARSNELKGAIVTQVINPSSGGGPGSGDVVGTPPSTDNAIAKYDGISGKLIQNSTAIVEDDGRISNVTDPTNAQDVATKAYADGIDADIRAEDFLTWSNEAATLPNSRRLVAGDRITFDDSVANVRTISADNEDDYVVMSDGADPPSPMNDGNGNFIYVTYNP